MPLGVQLVRLPEAPVMLDLSTDQVRPWASNCSNVTLTFRQRGKVCRKQIQCTDEPGYPGTLDILVHLTAGKNNTSKRTLYLGKIGCDAANVPSKRQRLILRQRHNERPALLGSSVPWLSLVLTGKIHFAQSVLCGICS